MTASVSDSRNRQFCLVAMAAFWLAAQCSGAPLTNNPVPDPAAPPESAAKSGSVKAEGTWLFAYFRQRYEGRVEINAAGQAHQVPLPNPMREEQLHFALSTDGRHWQPLNGNQPVWDHRLRDPFLHRGSDAVWRLLATGGERRRGTNEAGLGPACLYAASRDLLNWEDVRSLRLMQGVRDETGRPARNIWAPECFADNTTGDRVLLWSSSFEDAGWKKSRLWFARTRDWQHFSPAKELFAPPYSVIDGTLIEHNGTFYLFHKEEEFSPATGERRAIRVATANHLEGPYRVVQGPLNQGQIVPVITEGPAVIPDPQKTGWLLLYDYCMGNDYGISASPDLIHWSIEPAVSLPPDARHGSFARLSAAEAATLRARFPQKNN